MRHHIRILGFALAFTLTAGAVSPAQARESKRTTAQKLHSLERRRDISTLRNVLAFHEGEVHLKKLAPDLVLTYRGRSGFSVLKQNPPASGYSHPTTSRFSVTHPAVSKRPELKRLNVAEVGRKLTAEAKKVTTGPAPRSWKRALPDLLKGI